MMMVSSAMRALLCLTLILALLAPAFGAPESAPAAIDVILTLRGPDAAPLADADIVIDDPDRSSFADTAPPALRLHSDAGGTVRFSHPIGVSRLRVVVAGIGYALLGLTEFAAGHETTLSPPPLVPFAQLEGVLPPDLVGSIIEIRPGPPAAIETPAMVTPDAQGHFLLDLQAGTWLVSAVPPGTEARRAAGSSDAPGRLVTVHPGESLRDFPIRLDSPQQFADMLARQAALAAAPREVDRTVEWVHGIVRDEAGRPIAGAAVYARAIFFGGMRTNEVTLAARSDAEGRYLIEGSFQLRQIGLGLTIAAATPGRPPGLVWCGVGGTVPLDEAGKADASAPPPEPVEADITVPAQGGTLEVAVAGGAHGGAAVKASLDALSDMERAILPVGRKEEQNAIAQIIEPVALTGPDGVARFENLLPGSYRLRAVTAAKNRMDDDLDQSWRYRRLAAKDVIVRVGKTSHVAIAIPADAAGVVRDDLAMSVPVPKRVAFGVMRPDGRPWSGPTLLKLGRVEPDDFREDAAINAAGLGRLGSDDLGVFHPGLWRPGLLHLDAVLGALPADTSSPLRPPYMLASGVLAVSPRLGDRFVPRLIARRVEAASLRIRVEDEAGQPLSAALEIGETERMPFDLRPVATGQTDAGGEVQVAGLNPDHKVVVRAVSQRYALPDLGGGELPLPRADALRHRLALQPVLTQLSRDGETKVTVKAAPVGYVHGIVHLAEGEDPATAAPHFDLDWPEQWAGAQIRYRSSSGELVAGPFSPGTINVTVTNGWSVNGEATISVPAEILPGEVTEIEIPVPPPLRQEIAQAAFDLWPDAQVLMADGVTPAFGAELLYFDPSEQLPLLRAFVDARGEAQQILGSGGERKWASGPGLRTLLARLPGSTGFAVTTLIPHAGLAWPTDPRRMVLPPPVSAAGRVTIGGAAPSGTPGTIRVYAAYQDQGNLDDTMSVEAFADKAGRFTLAGLTPGRYLVQAALDEIWLSSAVPLEIRDRDPPPLSLAIPAPGAPILLQVLDRAGRRVPGAAITLDRPPGPLAERLWPKQWIVEGAGLVTIPTLEAGRQVLHGMASLASVMVDVPALPHDPVEATLRVDRSAGTGSEP